MEWLSYVSWSDNNDTDAMEWNTSDDVSMATTTLSPEEIDAALSHYNEVQALRYFPVFAFLVIVMVVGTIGNGLVLFVYCKRFRKTSSNYFIVAMAVFDMLACLIGLPTEIYDLWFSYTFYSEAVCKIFRYTEAVVVYGSAIILVEIAFDRYFKICKPLMLIELYKIKSMCIGAGIAAVLIAIPALILYGISRTETPDGRIQGFDCSIAEAYRKQSFSQIYYLMLGAVFVITVTVLTILYVRIYIEIRKRKKLVIGDQVQRPSKEEIQLNGMNSNDQKTKKLRVVRYCSEYSDEDSDLAARTAFRPTLQTLAEAITKFRVTRTTIVLFAVTVAFIISYLPGIIIMICRSAIQDLESHQTIAEHVLSKLFSKFYFLNNAINPIIYSFLNISFRRRCVILVKKALFCRHFKFKFRRPMYDKAGSQKSSKSTKSNKSTKELNVVL
ncbi:neuromedin-U receptor 1-like isoform X1 [Mya arenaria]|uniref:neuromedin-U receptor 1-like isoform X1 n=1 Tax=Mya arenaria TaxID=6604 RepID=UPI0022E29099|nr:neuromedin-U receptor 1-like isoform X1 [Mya arenaria]XP_052781989.1 neuromedin-U receptor 1-like isoform X1 [Mya arenaria]